MSSFVFCFDLDEVTNQRPNREVSSRDLYLDLCWRERIRQIGEVERMEGQ